MLRVVKWHQYGHDQASVSFITPQGQCKKNVKTKGVNIVYHTAGNGKGKVICLLPSTGRSGSDFNELCHALVQHNFKVILPEPRGIGGS